MHHVPGDAVAEVRRLDLVSAGDEEPEALLVAGGGTFGFAGELERTAECPQRVGAKLRFGVRGSCEQGLETWRALARFANEPESLERRGQSEAALGVVLGCPVERSADVVDLGREEIDIPLAGDADSRARARAIGQIEQPLDLEPAQGILLTRGVQALPCELADRLEHPEALVPVRIGAAADEALVEERRKRVEVRATDCFGRLEGAAAAEDGEPGKQLLFVVVEEVVAPGDRGA